MWHQQCHLHLSHLRGVGRARAQIGNCPPKHLSWKRTQSIHNLTFLQPRKALQCLTQRVCATVCSNLQWGWALAGKGCSQCSSSRRGPALHPGTLRDKYCILGCSNAELGRMTLNRWGGNWEPLHKRLPHWAQHRHHMVPARKLWDVHKANELPRGVMG